MLMFICINGISLRKQSAVRNNMSSVTYLQVEMERLTDKLPVT